MNNTLLLVDDEEQILRSLRRLFLDEDYEILTATSGEAGLEILKNNDVAVIVSDQMMPGMTGAEFLEKVYAITPHTMRMVLSGYAEIDAAIDAINRGGAFRYISKPWNDADLLLSVRDAFERYNLQQEHYRLQDLTKKQNEELNLFNTRLEDMLEDRTTALVQTKRYVEAILHSVAEGITVIDEDGFLQDTNESFLRLYGYTNEEVQAINFVDLCVDDEKDRMNQWLKDADNDAVHFESVHKQKNGVIFPVEATLVNMRTENDDYEFLGVPNSAKVLSIRDITRRREAEQQIEDSLEEKAVLLREIYHRVKNNMQVIASMLKMQSRVIEDKHYSGIFLECEHRIQSMALVHEKLYRSKELDKIELKSYIKTLAHDLLESYGANARRVSTKVEVSDIHVGLDTAVPCGLIVNELVSNAMKYAFPDNVEGLILVKMVIIGEKQFCLEVIDNGIGIPGDLDIAASNSLGLRLVKSFSRQLQGKFEFTNNNGTHFKLTFKDIG